MFLLFFTLCIAKNSNGWWYIKNGKVDFSAGDYSFAANTSQIIDVKTSGSTGTLTLYNKSGSYFTKVMSMSCYVGRNGITSDKIAGDGKTPSGVYTLGQAFGNASDPGSTRSYLKVNSNHYWVADSTCQYYNQLVDASKTGIVWNDAEHLIDYPKAYKYAIAINYNTSCTPYKGSAIFLRCSLGKATSGCVSVSEANMKKILQSLADDTRIYIH
ncbi:MAG: L,D-transpeptidase family protein [Lachnospiraceae bacterium]|nr:L,D-transpeptidase family protein [Lachnospiraceae bacterium]